ADAVAFVKRTAATASYTLSLHDALPICATGNRARQEVPAAAAGMPSPAAVRGANPESIRSPCQCSPADTSHTAGHAARRRGACRSEEHTSELQSRENLVCRLLLEKKKK